MEAAGSNDLPALWLSRPRPYKDAAWLLDAFLLLSRGRGYSMAGTPMPISLADIMHYASAFELDAPQKRRELVEVISHLDDQYLRHRQEEQSG